MKENIMSKPMTAFTTDLQHSGMIARDLDETIEFYQIVKVRLSAAGSKAQKPCNRCGNENAP